MALPTLSKFAIFLLIVFLIYTGYAFRIRDGSLLASSEQSQGLCDSVSGKCPERTVVNANLLYKKYQGLGLRGKLAKSQRLPVESEESVYSRTEKLASVKVVHGLRRLKVSRSETNAAPKKTVEEEKVEDEEASSIDDSLGEVFEEEGDTEEIEAEPDKSSNDDEDTDKGEEDKDDKSEKDEKEEDEGTKEVEFDKQADDDQESEDDNIEGKEIVDDDDNDDNDNNVDNDDKSEENQSDSEELSRKETNKHVFKIKIPHHAKKPTGIKSIITDQSSFNDGNVAEDNLKKIETKTSGEDDEDKKNDDDQDNENDEDDENEDDDDESNEENEQVMPTSAPRKLEKVRLADKEKAKSFEIRNVKAETTIDKPSEYQIVKNEPKGSVLSKPTLKSEPEKPKPKPSMKVKERANESEKVDKLKSASENSTIEKKSKSPEKSKKPLVETKKSATPEKKNTEPKKSRKQREASMTLAQLNDAILQVPTFVPNFTAVDDPICQQQGKIFLRQLRGFKLWALQMLDSSAKIPSSLLRGNVNQLGDFDQCLGISTRVKVEEKTVKVQGKYCLATVDLHVAHPDMKLPINLMQSRAFIRGTMRDPGHFIPRFTTVNWALCLPAACSVADAHKSMEVALKSYNMTSGIKFSINVAPEMCYVRQKPQNYSKETIGVLYLYATVLCLVLVATLRDCVSSSAQEKGNYSERIIMSFSLKRTIRSLFWEYNSGSGEITCIHGVRSLATMALYVAHKLIPLSRTPYANRVSLTEVANNPISSVLRVSLVYTDSFLLLSGVLTAFNMAKELKTRGEIRWFCRFVSRFIRLTPALIAVVFWYAFVMEHIGNGPQWNSVIKSNADICKKNAWTNLLYIQNFFPFEEMCATHTHQLALDMQLSLIVPMLVFFLEIKPIIGILLIFFLLQLSATLRYLATVNNNLSLVIFHGMTLRHLYKTANLTYVLPLHRATPYLFGVGLGVLLNYTGKSVKIHKVFSILGWLIASSLGFWSLFSPWRYARRDFTYDVENAAYYAVISPVSSALALSWVIFACFTGHGGFINKILSNYWLVVFSRISYAIYLSQFAVFFYNVGTTRYSSEFEIHRAIDPYEAAMVLAVSTILTLLFDTPLQEVKNVIMECTDGKSVVDIPKESSKEEVERKAEELTPKDEAEVEGFNIRSYDEDEEEPKRWNWQKGTFRELTPRETNENLDRNSVSPPRSKRQDVRRQSFIRMDHIDRYGPPWDLTDGDEAGRRSRSSHRTLMNESEPGDDNFSSERTSQTRNNIGPKDNEDLIPGMIRRERSLPRKASHREQIASWEMVGNKSEEDRQNSRSTRSMTRHTEARLLSSESEEDDRVRLRSRKRIPEPRVSDEEDWEQELRIQRRPFREKNMPHNQEETYDEERNFTRRRSSAEGKIALLRDPVGKEITFWTVSKVSQLGSSQEPSEPEEDEMYMRKGKYEKSSFIDTPSEEESSWDPSQRRSLNSGSQFTSVDDDESIATYDFVLKKDSKKISVQDLSKSSQEEEEVESGWNMVKGQDAESGKTSTGLFKRQSIVKSQASEEDPEYLLPERPKLVEQEQEHPFKKAWQEQKSRSEEDSYVVKDTKESKEDKDRKETKETEDTDVDIKELTQHSGYKDEGSQAREIDHFIDDSSALIWETGSADRESSNSRSSADPQKLDWPNEEEKYENYKLRRRKSDGVNWSWEQEET